MLDFEAKIKELEMKYESDIDEKAIKREAVKMKGISESNKQMLDQATKSLLQPNQGMPPQPMPRQPQPSSDTFIEIDVGPTKGTNKGPKS